MYFVKLRRKINYIKNLIQYVIISFIVRLLYIGNQNIDEFECVDISSNNEIVFLGEIAKEMYLDNLVLFEQLAEVTDNPSVCFCYSDIKDTSSTLRNVGNTTVCNVTNTKGSIIKMNDINIGYILFDLKKDFSIFRYKIELMKSRNLLRKNRADFLIAYVKGNNKEIGKLKKIIGTWGFDCVIGIDKKIKKKKNFRTLVFNETRIFYSLGKIENLMEHNNDAIDENKKKFGLVYKIEVQKYFNRYRLAKEGYIPITFNFTNNRNCFIKEITRNLWLDDIEKKYYLYIENIMRGFRPWKMLITLNDILAVLGEKLPSQYEYLGNFSVNQICARTYEIAPGNIFFFRRAFNDKNDIKIEREFFRNKLILRAFSRKSLFIFSYKKLFNWIPHIVVKDPTEAHIKVMAWYREKFISAKYIGVTGSVGKTSTKDMLYYVFREGFYTERNLRNSNVQVKIGINEQRVSSNTEVYIQEIGGGRPGGASRHSRMILPDAAVITNIGTAHIGNYNSQEELRDNKLGISDGMNKDGMLFLNGDDSLLLDVNTNCDVTYFALDNKTADCYADNIKEHLGTTYFDIVYGGKNVSAQINVLGEYNVLNAVCSYAIAKYFGMNDEDILKGLKNFKTTGIRQNLIKIGKFKFFVDCYNASIDSIDTSLSVLTKLIPEPGGKRIAIIGDVTGMGEKSEEINRKIVDIIRKYDVDKLVCYGKNARYIGSLLKSNKVESISIDNRSLLESWMTKNIKYGDVTLLKGSSKVKLDEILDSVFGLNLSDQRYIDEAHYSVFRRNKSIYKIFENYVSLNKYNGDKSKLVIPNKVSQRKLKKITQKAFYNNKFLKNIKVSKNIIHIGSFSFANCKKLENIEFQGSIKFVGRGAFMNCINLKRVEFDKNLICINSNAFKNCKSLEEVILPKDIGYVSKSAFKGTKAKIKYI